MHASHVMSPAPFDASAGAHWAADARRRTRRASMVAWILALVLVIGFAGVLSSAAGALPALPRVAERADLATAGGAADAVRPTASDERAQARQAASTAAGDDAAIHLNGAGRSSATAEASFVGVAATGGVALVLFAAAGALLLLLGLFLLARTRRTCDDCARTVGRDEPSMDLTLLGFGELRVCGDCAGFYSAVSHAESAFVGY